MFKQRKMIVLLIAYLVFGSALFAASPELTSDSMLSILFGAFVSGLLLTFTPCVLPMIPIVSSIIAGGGEDMTKRKALMLSSSYVLGTAFTYAMIGAVAGATGEQLQAYFQNAWIISFMSIVFVLMALSMFGLFIIELPASISARLSTKSSGIKGGNIFMVFLLGMISALILGACVSPILISFLSVAIAAGDPVLGAMTMFSLAMGMGIPLVLVGLGAGHLLPKAGWWMENVKYFFGVILLGVAITIFNTLNLLPELLAWGILFVVVGIYMGATKFLKDDSSGWDTLAKGIGTVLLIWGVFLLIGASYGERSILNPLPKQAKVYAQATQTVKKDTFFETITSMEELEIKKEYAIKHNKFLMIYFYTDWCPVCKQLKETTLVDWRVNKRMRENFISVKVNMTDKDDDGVQKIRKTFKIYGPPAFVFFDNSGKLLEGESLYGYQDAVEFNDILELMAE